MIKHPLILWAQRSNNISIAVEVEDLKIDELKIQDDLFKIRGKRGNSQYEAVLQLYDKIAGDDLRKISTDRRLEFVIPKEKAGWWPRLLKEKTKVPWIKVDFDKWKDEDEETEENDMDFGNMDFSNFGLPGGGKPGALDDLDMDDNDADSDEMGELEDIEGLDDKNEDAKPEGAATEAFPKENIKENVVTENDKSQTRS